MTGRLTEIRVGETLQLWGPLGRPFLEINQTEHVALFAGGFRLPFRPCPPLLEARIWRDKPQGARKYRSPMGFAQPLSLQEWTTLSVPEWRYISPATIAQSVRRIRDAIFISHDRRDPLVGCGPEPMLHALSKIARDWKVPCQVSLETPMACGIGICFSCVTRVKTADSWDYKPRLRGWARLRCRSTGLAVTGS